MTVYFDKRRGRWTYDFELARKRYHGYCLDEAGAPVTSRAAARLAESTARRAAMLAPKIARPGEMTIAMAAEDLTPVWTTEACWGERQRWVKEILAFFGPDTAIAAIDQARIDDYVAHCRTAPILAWHGGPRRDPADPRHAAFWRPTGRVRAPATANLYLGTLRQILARAGAHRDPTTRRPAFEHLPTVPELKRPKRKARPMPDQVAAEVMAIMPPHVVDAMVLTELFGFRRGEVFALETHQVDWAASGLRLAAEDVKDAEDVFLPASDFAMGWLRCLAIEAEARGTTRLITWRRARKDPGAQAEAPAMALKAPRGAWRRAQAFMRERYGRTWRWHDLRAAFITTVALTSGGVVAQALARHSDAATTQGYIEVADEMRRLAAERIADRPLLFAGESPRRPPQTLKLVTTDRTKKSKD